MELVATVRANVLPNLEMGVEDVFVEILRLVESGGAPITRVRVHVLLPVHMLFEFFA